MNTFWTCFAKNLKLCVEKHPNKYSYGPEEVTGIVAKMQRAYPDVDKSGMAFKATCKDIQIPLTYKAIDHFITNHV